MDGVSGEVIEAVEGFLADVERSDLLLLYFSCHGLKDEYGRLYFATRNTSEPTAFHSRLRRGRQRPAAWLSFAPQGPPARLLLRRGVREGHAGEGRPRRADGRAVRRPRSGRAHGVGLDAVRLRRRRPPWIPHPVEFTAVLVDGLSNGEADLYRDGLVTVDDAYDFVPGATRRRERSAEPPQVGVRRCRSHRSRSHRGRRRGRTAGSIPPAGRRRDAACRATSGWVVSPAAAGLVAGLDRCAGEPHSKHLGRGDVAVRHAPGFGQGGSLPGWNRRAVARRVGRKESLLAGNSALRGAHVADRARHRGAAHGVGDGEPRALKS